jgi:MFS family permease
MIFAGNAGQVLVFGSLIGAGTGLFLSANWALANDLSPTGKGGAFLGLTNLATAGAGALSRLFGPAIDSLNALESGSHAGYTLLFAAAAFLTIGSMTLLIRIPESVMDKESVKPADTTP